MKKKILALAIGGVLSAGAQAASINDILLTEYVEGGGAAKRAFELTNTSNEDYTFLAGEVAKVQNYNLTWEEVELVGKTIPANGAIVIIDDGKDATLISSVKAGVEIIDTNNLPIIGDDAVALTDSSGAIVDIIGTELKSGDPSPDWGKDLTLRRRAIDSDGTFPSQSTSFDIAQWEALAKDTFDGLGDTTLSEASIPSVPKSINEIQGGYFDGLKVEVTGTVSAVLTSAVQGFYIYQENNDGNPATSDGLFVNSAAFNIDDGSRLIAAGDVVTLVGTITESYGQTELKQIESTVVDSTGGTAPAAVDLKMIKADNGSFKSMMRRYDGMFVNLPTDIDQDDTSDPDDEYTGKSGDQTMRVTQPYTTDFRRFHIENMHLSYDSVKVQPNQENVAGSEDAEKAIQNNKDKTLIVAADNSSTVVDIIDYYPDFNPATATDYDATKHAIRINDGVVGLKGAVQLVYGTYTLYVPQGAEYYATKDTFVKNTPRTDAPVLDLSDLESDEFTIKVATQNVLNLFNSPFGGDLNLHGDNRGAETEEEFIRQRDKIVQTIRALDVDILGLMEIENNGFGTFGAINDLVTKINEYYTESKDDEQHHADAISKRYVFVGFDSDGNTVLDNFDSIGSDAITSGLIYRPATVSINSSRIISMPQQHAPTIVNDNNVVVKDKNNDVLESGDNYMRETVSANFTINQTGKRLTVAVNHFKSKGSTCWEDWEGTDFGDSEQWTEDEADIDQQGNCENFRVAAAVQLGTELEKLGGDQVVIGDFNSYAKEDPMLVLTENTTNKTLTAARDTFIGKMPQYGENGAVITENFGFINVVQQFDADKGHPSWSYIWNDEVGSLDHLLVTPSLKNRVLDAVDWHINSSEAPLLDYKLAYKGNGVDGKSSTEDDNGSTLFYKDDVYRSSDHDSAVLALSYKYGETENNQPVTTIIKSGLTDVPYAIPAGVAKAGDTVKVSLKATGGGADLSDAIIPNLTVKNDGDTLVQIEIGGLSSGTYDVTMSLERASTQLSSSASSSAVSGSEVRMNIEASKQDSLTPKIPTPETDGSGGSFGIFGILSLLGLGFLRRK